MIIHTDQKEPVCRGCCPGFRARPGLQQRNHVIGLTPATADFHERPDNRSDHVAEEPVSSNFIREETAGTTP